MTEEGQMTDHYDNPPEGTGLPRPATRSQVSGRSERYVLSADTAEPPVSSDKTCGNYRSVRSLPK